MSDKVIGTCSQCGGPVCTMTIIHSPHPPTPQCKECGAVPKTPYGPIIETISEDSGSKQLLQEESQQ